MKIVFPGGSGHVGTVLCRAMHEAGHQVVVLSRKPANRPWRVVAWDGTTVGAWAKEIDGCDVVVNLAGRSVDCRYSPRNRRAIMNSRVDSTRAVGRAIAASKRAPRLWLQASTATIYEHSYDTPNDERGTLGGNEPNAPDTWKFSIDVARAWERAADEAETPATRKVLMRMAMMMCPDRGGTLDTLLRLVRFGLGGKAGDGRQFMSWITDGDLIRSVAWLIDHEELQGPVNVAAPHPLPNVEFMQALRDAWGIRFGLPAAPWMIETGAFFLRTESELILKSRRVVPGKMLQSGFEFDAPTWPAAAVDLCRRRRAARGRGAKEPTATAAGLPC